VPEYDDLLGSGVHLRLVRREGWEYAEHLESSASVAVLALTRSNEVVLIEQRRTPVDRVVLELPAGIVDPGETPESAVLRELLEETGYTAEGPPELLLSAPILAGLTSSILHLFRVRCGERIAAGGGVEDERIRVRLVPLAELERSPLDGYEAVDWHIPAALQLARVRDGSKPVLYQTEWCPFSSAVREVLTELGIDYEIRQVEPFPKEREELRALAGTDMIPVLQAEDGQLYRGTREIFRYLSGRKPSKYAAKHRRRFAAHSEARLTDVPARVLEYFQSDAWPADVHPDGS
jgi:ADP-ribose pyrophosphatase